MGLRYGSDPLSTKSAALFCVLLVLAAAAQAEPVDFDIEAQRLAAALREFSRQSGLQLIYAAGDVEGVASPGVAGTLEPLEALSQLLGDSGLEVRSGDGDIVVLAAASTESPGETDDPPRKTAGTRVVEEIIVTAAKRKQPLSDLPMSVSVLTADQLNDPQFRDLSEFGNWIPNTTVPGTTARRPTYAIRGMSGSSTNGRSVDVLVDGATSSTIFNASNPALLDFERVEIIRGSQGTLYGQNSLAGTIKFVSVRPKYESLEGEVLSSGWSTSSGDDSWQGSAVVNLPLGDRVAARLGVSYEDMGGFIDNYSADTESQLPDELIEKDVNDMERTAFRGALSWQASDRLELYLTARQQTLEQRWAQREKLRRDPPGGDSLTPFGEYLTTNPETVFRDVPESDEKLATLEVVYEFDSMTLTSETTYYENEETADLTSTQLIPGNVELVQVVDSEQLQENRSQEFRLTSLGDDRLQWVAGILWREEEFSSDTNTENSLINFLLSSKATIERSQVSIYGNLSYDLTERFAVDAGLRWFEDDVDRVRDAQSSFGGVERPPSFQSRSGRFDTTSPRLAISYALNDQAFVFSGLSKGFRGGTLNLGDNVPPELASAEPDENWTYELGLKGRWLGGRLAGDIILFYNDWDDIQAQVVEMVDGQFVFASVNGESAHSQGVEWRFSWIPVDALSLSVTGHYIDSELDSSVRGESGPSTTGIREGNELIYAPRRSLTLRADWGQPFGADREVYAGLHLMTRAGNYSSLSNEPVSKTPSFDQGNVKLGLRTESWDVSVFANNVWNERGYVYQQGAFSGLDQVGFGAPIFPRRVGLSVRYRF